MFYRKNVLLALSSAMLLFLNAVALAATAAAELERGKELYNQGKYDQAVDSFINVFVDGNGDQQAEANEYVNMIHFNMGSVEPPKQVDYDPQIEAARAALKEQSKEIFKSPASAPGGDAASEESPLPSAPEGEVLLPLQEVQIPGASTPGGDAASEESPSPVAPEEDIIIAEDPFLNYDTEDQKRARKELIDADVKAMTQKYVDALNSLEGVNVYMRNGKVDAVDIASNLIFAKDGFTFQPSAKKLLENLYSLMIVSGEPTFHLMPPGAYSDDVSLHGVKQAMALNSYLINMGLSSAKVNFNMGLSAERPPAKFADLEGISVVFDYSNKPAVVRKAVEKDSYPVLSLGIVPFDGINPSKDEGMLVDFSVVQTYKPIAGWKIQIVWHNKDGKFYVVRQIIGSGPVYQQFFWNGKKEYFGQILPEGRYTIILLAQDSEGREKIVRRPVMLFGGKAEKSAAKGEPLPAATEVNAASRKAKPDYKTPRLWKKPKRAKVAPHAELGAAASLSAPETVVEIEPQGHLEDEDSGFNPEPVSPLASEPSADEGHAFEDAGANTFTSVNSQNLGGEERGAASPADI